MLAGDEARRLGAALAAVAELEGQGGLADIRARLRERRQAARGEGAARQGSGRIRGRAERVQGGEGEQEGQEEHEYWHAAWMIEGKTSPWF